MEGQTPAEEEEVRSVCKDMSVWPYIGIKTSSDRRVVSFGSLRYGGCTTNYISTTSL